MKNKLLMSLLVILAGGFSSAAEVNPEAQRLIGLETANLAVKSLPPEVPVHGSVLSPAPLIDLYRAVATAQETLGISKESLERSEKLYASGELVARKDVQAAQAQHVLDKSALQSLEDRLVLEWGPRFSNLKAAERIKLIDDLLAGHVAIARLSLLPGEKLSAAPLAARLHAFGQERSQVRCTGILPAPAVDPAFQAQVFLGLLETPPAYLAVGMTLAGVLELRAEPRAGVFVPQEAVVFYLGKAWIYQKMKGDVFERVEVPVETPVEGGWFVAGDVFAHHPVVSRSAQSILSLETLGPAEEE